MSEWKKVKIGEICQIIKGTTGIASADPGEFPLVVTAVERKTCSSFQFDCEAVCIPLVSSSGHGKKSLNNVHYQKGKFALGTILCAVIPNNPNELDARFLHQYLQFYKDKILVPLMKGAANVSLSMKDISKVEIPLPSIEKQHELSELFVETQKKYKDLLEEAEKQKSYVKLLRQNILQEAIEGNLTEEWRKDVSRSLNMTGYPEVISHATCHSEARSTEESLETGKQLLDRIIEERNTKLLAEWEEKLKSNPKSKKPIPIVASEIDEEEIPFEIPKSWCWCRLGEVSRINGGYSFKSTEYTENGIRVIRISDFNENGFVNSKIVRYEDSDVIKPYYLEEKNILMALTGGTVGKSFFVTFLNEAMAVNQRVATVQKIIQKAKHSTNDNISLLDLVNMLFPLPPLAEQKEIVSRVETLLADVTKLEEQIAERETLAKQMLRSIMKDAFREE